MSSVVRRFGAPVMDPGGNAAATASSASLPAARSPRTVVTSWCTVAKDSTAASLGTRTLPGSQDRARSLRSRSAIIKFSARDLTHFRKTSARLRSSPASLDRAAVPLMGLASTRPPGVTLRNRSGDEQQTAQSASARRSRNAECGAGLPARSRS